MTREEAIQIFNEVLLFGKAQCTQAEFKELAKMSIKALEQEPCEDAVSREQTMAIIYKIKENHTSDRENHPINYGTLCDINLQLVNLPSVTPTRTRKWIPISERLPEESITVIGTTKFDDIYKTELYDDCGEKKWYANGNFDVPIVAWMPLPKPYKAESEE